MNARIMKKSCWTLTAVLAAAMCLVYTSIQFLENLDWPAPATKRTSIINRSSLLIGNDDKTPYDFSRKRPKAVILILARDGDFPALLNTLESFEQTFNAKYNYPYVLLNDKPFLNNFKKSIVKVLETRNVSFGLVPKEQWSYPEWIDQTEAAETRARMKDAVIYGGSESYRHMCRFYSGFFYRHPLLLQYDYYWRIEPGAQFYCRMDYDPFLFMMKNRIEYGFVQMMPEHMVTVTTLWNTTRKYLKDVASKLKLRPVESPVLRLVLDVHRKSMLDDYIAKLFRGDEFDAAYERARVVSWSGCHFWSNFEIGHFGFFRSALYQSYFDYLDKAGGFFYERWGDAPVHTLAAGLFLNYSQIHHFDDIGYFHAPYSWCPIKEDARQRCNCDPNARNNMARKDNKDGNGDCIFKLLADLRPTQANSQQVPLKISQGDLKINSLVVNV